MSTQGGTAGGCAPPGSTSNSSSSSSSSSCSFSASPQLQLYQTIIFATPVLFSFFLLILFCLLCIKRRRDSENIENADHPNAARHSFNPPGLSKSFRQMLPVIPFDEKLAASSEHNQCAVCLGEYQLNEKLQQLPVCKHSFHLQCIDEWLSKHTTCPICRISLAQDGRVMEKNSPDISFSRGNALVTDNRRWEERVANLVSPENGLIRPDASGASSSGTATTMAVRSPQPSPSPSRFSSDHAINIERS